MKKKNIILGTIVAGILSITLLTVVFFLIPANSVTIDVNPSIEISTNRLNKVLSVNPLNKEAENLLNEFSIKDNDLENVVNDLVDLMILTGHISGGSDNLVMITVNEENANPGLLDKVNQLIAAYLQNKQIEATVFSQAISYNNDDKKVAADNDISQGKLELIRKIIDKEDNLFIEQLTSISLKEILITAEKLDIKPDDLFDKIIKHIVAYSEDKDKRSYDFNSLIGHEQAIEIALELTDDGIIVEFELDKDDDFYTYEIKVIKDGMEYEIEIDAYTGKVLKYEVDDHDDYDKNMQTEQLIGHEQAIQSALGQTGDGTDDGIIVEFELDKDDGYYTYEIKVIKDGMEYDIEIDAYTGDVLKYEVDDDDDDDYDENMQTEELIGRENAIKIALGLTGGGKVVEFEMDEDDGYYTYEIKVIKDGMEYEIEIDAQTDEVLEFEMDD